MKIGIDRVNSLSIQAEYRAAHCNHGEEFGTYWHPEHPDSRDWSITLYRVCDSLVFSTNGDPIWDNCDEFSALLAEYGINIEEALAE
jgi:hypothetical protein